MPHKENIEALGQLLGELTTAENAEKIAKGKDLLSSLDKDYGNAVEEGQKAKDSLVRLVQNMPVKQEGNREQPDPSHASTPTIDEALSAALKDVEKAKEGKQ